MARGSSSPVPSPPPAAAPVVIKVSPVAHLAVGFLTLGLLIPVMLWPPSAPLLLLPVLLSALIVRLRTVADDRGVIVRTLLDSRTVRWDDIDGLRFHRGSWARARLKSGDELRLPAVTFATLPELTRASAGRVPNPYQ
ncbi:PH domain-containing protein [Mycobacterium avium subsp. hominissuis]